MGDRPRLLLLDGHSLAYRAFFALPVENFSTTTGQPTNAVYGFTAMLINVLRDEQPTHLAVALDAPQPHVPPRGLRRLQGQPLGDAGRDFRGQLSLIREVLEALAIPMVSAPGFEADDVIATLATKGRGEGMDVLVVTGDRDALQLVGDDVTVLMTRRGISDMTRFTPRGGAGPVRLVPAQYPDFAAIRGDPRDNLPSIPGVGEKTAAKWISQFGSLDALVDRVDEVPGRRAPRCASTWPSVVRNGPSPSCSRDVAMAVGPRDLRLGSGTGRQSTSCSTPCSSGCCGNGCTQTLSAVEPEADQGFEVQARVLGARRGGAVARGELQRPRPASGCIARNLGSGHRRRDRPRTGDRRKGRGGFIDPVQLIADDETALAAWLADHDRHKAVHDVKGPLLALQVAGWQLEGVTSDTALAAYLALPGQRSFDLADLALRYLHRELRAEVPADGQLTLDGSGEQDEAEADVVRARAVVDLAHALDADLERRSATRLLREVELPLTGILARMEETGIAADADHLAHLDATYGAEVKKAADAAYASVGHEFNLGSPKQLQQVLFDELELPKTKKIKTGYTTDADALVWLATQSEHPVLESLLRHRDVSRLKTVVDSLIPMVDDSGRIHTTFNQMIAATGRLSSTDPNLQNIPVRTAEGRQIRQAFIVGRGYECLLTADYSQIEMRIMAHLSGDSGLIEAFTSGEDVHTWVASRAFDVAPDRVDPELRRRIKAMAYGLAYGLSDFGLAAQLGISREEAREQMEAYFARFGKVRDFLHGVVAQARRDGYTETLLGRRRYLPDLTSDNFQRRQMAERMALNAPIQGMPPTSSRSRCWGWTRAAARPTPREQVAAAGARRACPRDRPGRAGTRRGARAAADVRRLCDVRASGSGHRRWPDLGRSRALSTLPGPGEYAPPASSVGDFSRYVLLNETGLPRGTAVAGRGVTGWADVGCRSTP